MIERVVAGSVPAKHHIAHRIDGELCHEECITRDGFDGPYTIAYHQRRPHITEPEKANYGFEAARAGAAEPLARRHFDTNKLAAEGKPPVSARVPLLFNSDVMLSMLKPGTDDPVYFANADGDDLYYIFQGSGVLRTQLGNVPFAADDYVYVPRGLMHRFELSSDAQCWLSIECQGLAIPKQWRNPVGQLRMDAPFCHRDFRLPTFEGPTDSGIRSLVVKQSGEFHGFRYQDSPFDVVGWDGTVYPFAFPILNFQPRAGLVHLPPTWHGTFAARGALVCSFVPRVVDFHPEAVPCPYPHSSVDCDEFLFYCRGNFTSRRGIGPGSISYHPAGIAHGPHAGAYEASIGTTRTDELAVMLDTFGTLVPTAAAQGIADAGYHRSFA